MNLSLKQLVVKIILSALRGLVYLKQNAGGVFFFLIKPFFSLWRFSFQRIGLPLYSLVFFLRRHLVRLYLPARNRFLFLFTNRFVFHAAIVMVAATTSVINIQTNEVRAETFGSKSLLLSLVEEDDLTIEEEVLAEQVLPAAPSDYLDTLAISPEEIDFDVLVEDQIATVLGGSVLTTPMINENQESLAVRTTIEEYEVQEGDVLEFKHCSLG
jgi:hypothetical protein